MFDQGISTPNEVFTSGFSPFISNRLIIQFVTITSSGRLTSITNANPIKYELK